MTPVTNLHSTVEETDVSAIAQDLSGYNQTFPNLTAKNTARVPFMLVGFAGSTLSIYLLVSSLFYFNSKYVLLL